MFSNTLSKITSYAKAHKVISVVGAIIVIVVIVYGVKKATAAPAQTQYVLGTVEQGTIISTVSGTGQVAAARELQMNPAVSGAVTAVYVKPGDQVKAGQALLVVDNKTAYNSYVSAQNSLKSAELSLQRLVNPDQLTSLQTQDALIQAQQNLNTDEVALEKGYDDGYSNVATAFVDIPGAISDINSMLLNGNSLSSQQYRNLSTSQDYINKSNTDLQTARQAYNTVLTDYRSTSRSSATSTIEALITETGTAVHAVSNALSDVSGYVDYIIALDPSSTPSQAITADKATITSDISKINGDLASLTSAINNINNNKKSVVSDQLTLSEKQTSSNQGGVSTYDLQSAQLSVSVQQANLANAESTLANYTVRAPFDGTVAQVNDLVGDQAGSDAITLVTSQETAKISLNEIDAAKVNVGDKATLTFDAFPSLSLTGTVGEVDTIGTVSQGVVNYSVTIVFDTQDSDIKPGMSVSAAIITNSKTDIVIVPSSAIKSDTQGSYVQELNGPTASSTAGVTSTQTPVAVSVTTGISDDTNTEIISGLNVGDKIITQTISGTAKTTTSSSGFSLFGGGATRGGAATGRATTAAAGK